MIPRHTGLSAIINQRLLPRAVAKWARSEGTEILWTYSPINCGLENVADETVYHSVDLLGKVDGISKLLIERSERKLAEADPTCFGSSPAVVANLVTRGFSNVHLWRNVAETRAINEALANAPARRSQRVLFAGHLTHRKVDFSLLHHVLESGADLHLAGPIAQHGRSAQMVRSLVSHGATYHGVLPRPALAQLYWSSAVVLILYVSTPYTAGVSPMRTFEYLAAGIIVVSTDAASFEPRPGDVVITSDDHEFVSVTRAAMFIPSPGAIRRRREVGSLHSWVTRGREARAFIADMTNHLA